MTLKTIAKTALNAVAPGYMNRRYLDWATPREIELALLPAMIEPGRAAIDVGANRGLYVHHLLVLGAKVIAFEPLPPMQRWLERQYGKRIDLRPLALSDRHDTAEIRYPRGNYSWATIASSNKLEMSAARIETLRVPMLPLDALDLEDVAFVKIDVEGYEEAVLRGGMALLRRQMPNLLIEIEERHNAGSIARIRDMLEGLGYAGFYVQNGSLQPIAGFDPARDQRLSEIDLSGKTDLYVNNFLFVARADAPAFGETCAALLARAPKR